MNYSLLKSIGVFIGYYSQVLLNITRAAVYLYCVVGSMTAAVYNGCELQVIY